MFGALGRHAISAGRVFGPVPLFVFFVCVRSSSLMGWSSSRAGASVRIGAKIRSCGLVGVQFFGFWLSGLEIYSD